MNGKSLFETNPFLRDLKRYKKGLITNVGTSTSVEIGHLSPSLEKDLKNYDLNSFSLLLIDSTSLFLEPQD